MHLTQPFSAVSVERLQFIRLHWCFILMEMCKRVLGTVVVRIIVCVDGLSLQARNGVELLDCCSAQTCERSKNSSFDFRNLSILDCVHKGVLRLGSMVLELLRCVLLAKWGNLVEIHFQVMCHLLSKVIFWSAAELM